MKLLSISLGRLLIFLNAVVAPTIIAAQPAVRADGPDQPVELITAVSPAYPSGMRNAGVNGNVLVEFIVTTEGQVSNPVVIQSNNPWLERSAIEAILKWKFRPARHGGRVVDCRVQQELVFTPNDGDDGQNLWRATKGKNHDKLPLDYRWDSGAVPVSSTYPVYPAEGLQAKKKGRAVVHYVVNTEGRPQSVVVKEASSPEFGGAALASIDVWRFQPATRAGQPCLALIQTEFQFDPDGNDSVPVSDGMSKIINELSRPTPRIFAPDELDSLPKALSSRPPIYPSSLLESGPPGEAMIEFYLDKNGDAQLPRVVSASAPEFGYAAAQAISAWRYERPMKDGKPVIARLQVPIVFPAEGAWNAEPKLRVPWPPSYPDELKQAGTEGRVIFEFLVCKDGAVRYPRIVKSSHPAFEKAVINAVWKWIYVPGRKDGQTVACLKKETLDFRMDGKGTDAHWKVELGGTGQVWEGHFVGAGQNKKNDRNDAILREWIQPVFPENAKELKQEGFVTVDFVVENDGHVSKAEVSDSTNGVFDEAAKTAVTSWTFSPAVEEGKPTASGMTVAVEFKLDQLQGKEAAKMPVRYELLPRSMRESLIDFVSAPDPEYPAELAGRKLPGAVKFDLTVGPDGRVGQTKVLLASHAAFVPKALQVLESARFDPARQGLLVKTSSRFYEVKFSDTLTQHTDKEILLANQMELATGTAKLDLLPSPVMVFEPVYPHAHLLAGGKGSALVEFTVKRDGKTAEAKLISASTPEFGAALLAAVDTWLFKAAVYKNSETPVRLRATHEFMLPVEAAETRLLEKVRENGAGIAGAAGLDRPLKPIWQAKPTYPSKLLPEKMSGQASVECIIDCEGRVRLPRVKSASREEFGWAAATAISQWVFERPMRKGEPVDVTVTIPVNFNPPKS